MAKVALLVGVSEYEPGLNPLPAAVKDVEAIQQVLLHTDIGGFVQADVTLLTNPARQQMEEAIENLFAGRHRDDLVLFFFSGHGIKDDTGRLYLATHKTRKNPQGDLIRSSAVSANFVQESMSRSRSRRQVVILDCCFSGAFAQGLLVRDDGTVNIQEQLGGEGRAILTSSSSTQYSFEQEGSELSIYTRYLIEGIQTGVADLDEDGFISIDELHEYAKKKVREIQPLMKPEIYAIREGFKIRLTKVPLIDPKQKYRKEVARYIDRGEISFVGRNILDIVRNRFRLSVAEATAIENEILEPYRKQFREKLKQYEQVFTELIKRKPIISEIDRQQLRHFQQSLHLDDEDTASIEKQVTAVIEAYRKNLQQYEQEFSKAVRQEYPLSASTSNQLQQMQQQLQLADEDISFIQTRVTAEVGAYKQKLQQYENLFLSAIQKEYPFSEAKRQELQEQQGFLELTHEDVAPIKARITAQIEEHQQKLRQYEQVLNNEIERAYPMSDRTREELRRFQQALELSDFEVDLIKERVFTNREVVSAITKNLPVDSASPPKQNQQLVQEQTTQNVPSETPLPISSPIPELSNPFESFLQSLKQKAWQVVGGLGVGVLAIGIIQSQLSINESLNNPSSPPLSTTASSPAKLDLGGQVRLTGAGASFPAPLYQTWFQALNQKYPNLQVNYQSVGSGAGVEQFTKGNVDFGASDVAMKDEEIKKVQNGVLLLPMTAGSIVMGYNLPGIQELKLPRDVYTGIFLGTIKSWDDAKINAANPGVKLPKQPITVVHRSDGSGTTGVFTKHLSAISPEWKSKVGEGKTVSWPTGVGAKGNEGVTAQIQQTQGAIGYVEYGYAAQNKLTYAALQNKAGEFVLPTDESASKTLDAVELPENLRAFITDPEGKDSYPIVTYTWLLVYKKYPDAAKAKAIEAMIEYGLTEGQKAAPQLGYVPLPASVVKKVTAAADAISPDYKMAVGGDGSVSDRKRGGAVR